MSVPGGKKLANGRRGSLPATSLADHTQRKEVWSPIEEDLVDMRSRICKLELQLTQMRTGFDSRNDGNGDSAHTKAQLAESQEAVEMIKRQLNEAMSRLRQREALLSQREQELDETRRDVDNLNNQRLADQRELANLKDVVKTLRGQLVDREHKIKALETKLVGVVHELDTTKREVKHTSAALKKTQEELKGAKRELKTAKDDLNKTTGEMKVTKQELKITQEKMTNVEDQVKRLSETLGSLVHTECTEDLAQAAQQRHHHQYQQQQQHHQPDQRQHHQTAAAHHQASQPRSPETNSSLSLPPIRYNFPPQR